MNTQWLKICPLEPLLLGQVKPDTNFLASFGYIPGRVVRGAFAEWLIACGRESEIPELVRQIHICNFFPTVETSDAAAYVSPFMLSMITCKNNPGFKSDSQEEPSTSHGVVDSLIPHLAYHLLREEGAIFPVPFGVLCSTCLGRMENETGFFAAYQGAEGTIYARAKLMYHSQTRAAISRFRRAAVEGMLYTATGLNPYIRRTAGTGNAPVVFLGKVHAANTQIVDDLVQALNEMPIGAMRNRGYGKVSAEYTQVNILPIEKRIQDFNNLLQKLKLDIVRLAVNVKDTPASSNAVYFSVDLISPAIFYVAGRPALRPRLIVAGQTLDPIFHMTRPDFAGGWSDVWGLPKPTSLAACIGSSYVFRWDGDMDVLLQNLGAIEDQGIGERRDEGFGECLICHPFHQEVEER